MWTLGGIRIFVQDLREHTAQIIPRLQPLSGGTVLQTFGHEDDIRTVVGLVVGQADKDDLKDMTTGGSVELVSPEGSEGSYEVKDVKVSRLMVICQTLRPDLPEDSPVYSVEIELYA